MHFLGVKLQFSAKRDPFVRQNFKCGPLCKAWPKIKKGAGSKDNVIWEQGQGAQKFGKGSSKKLGNGARSKRNYQGAARRKK